MADSVVPLCTPDQFRSGALKDLASGYDAATLNDVLIEATRLCEDETTRRLAPFTTTQAYRATGVDPDEYADTASMPMDIYGSLGMSYASALSVSSLVRHMWLQEYAPRYEEMWAYSGVSTTVVRSYGGTEQLVPSNILGGPEPDTGHMWFQLGIFLPVGSRLQVTYSGGYQTVPASLVRACKLMGAFLIIRELDPDDTSHDPDLLREDAVEILGKFGRG